MYILEQRSSRGTSQICPSWPHSGHVLNPSLAPSYEHASYCHAQPSVHTTVNVNGSSFTLTSSSIWVASHQCTSKHHNNDTWYRAHISWAGWLSSILFVRYSKPMLVYDFCGKSFPIVFSWLRHFNFICIKIMCPWEPRVKTVSIDYIQFSSLRRYSIIYLWLFRAW
jgi:hypothetical protein